MKKLTRIISTVLAGLMLVSALPVATASAATVTAPKKVTVSNTKKGVKVTWSKATNAKKCVVMRKLSKAKEYTTVKTINNAKAGSYVDKTAIAGEEYTYKVNAVNGTITAESKTQTIVRLTTPVLDDKSKDDYVYFKWKKVKGAKRYHVYRAKVSNGKTGEYKLVSKPTYNSYYDDASGTYKYKVVAVKGKSQSAESKVLKKSVIQSTYVYADMSNDYTGVKVRWEPVKNVDGYRIYRSTSKKDKGVLIADLSVAECVIDKEYSDSEFGWDVYIYTDTPEGDQIKYYYTVEAYLGKLTSSDTASVEFKSAEYFVKVGGVCTTVAEQLEETQELMKELVGQGYVLTLSVTSEDESIFTVDENYNIIGVSEGKANVVVKIFIAYAIDGTTSTTTSTTKLPVKVTPAN